MRAPAIAQLGGGIQVGAQGSGLQDLATFAADGLSWRIGLEIVARAGGGLLGRALPSLPAPAAEGTDQTATPTTVLNDNPVPMSEAADIESTTEGGAEAGPLSGIEIADAAAADPATMFSEHDPSHLPVAGEGGETDYSMTEYLDDDVVFEVELLAWRAIRDLIPTDAPMVVIDVRTGITFNMRCVSKGRHADVEPLTREDTEAIKTAFGGRWSWTPRPVWVIFDGRVFAASINGTPHGGSTISGNGMSGHLCMHFQGSRTHNGNVRHENDHQNAIMEAWDAR
jgi:hypothetical protein